MANLRPLVRSSVADHVYELPEFSSVDLKDVPLDILCAAARAQGANYMRGEVREDTAGVELFRRAIGEHDEAAWGAVISVYRGLLIAQAGRQLVRKLVDEDDGFCVDRAFQRFWKVTRADTAPRFADLASILKYLKMCLASVLLDEARVRRVWPTSHSTICQKAFESVPTRPRPPWSRSLAASCGRRSTTNCETLSGWSEPSDAS